MTSQTGVPLVADTGLCTVAEAKAYMGKTDTDDDTLLTAIVAAASQKIQRLCNREFLATDYREWVTGDNQRSFALKQHPVIYIDRISHGASQAITASATGFIKATIQAYDLGVRCSTMDDEGTATANDLTFATYPTTTLLAAAVEALTGWTSPIYIDSGSTYTVVFTHPDYQTLATEVTI